MLSNFFFPPLGKSNSKSPLRDSFHWKLGNLSLTKKTFRFQEIWCADTPPESIRIRTSTQLLVEKKLLNDYRIGHTNLNSICEPPDCKIVNHIDLSNRNTKVQKKMHHAAYSFHCPPTEILILPQFSKTDRHRTNPNFRWSERLSKLPHAAGLASLKIRPIPTSYNR